MLVFDQYRSMSARLGFKTILSSAAGGDLHRKYNLEGYIMPIYGIPYS